jgi:hypothetical protein
MQPALQKSLLIIIMCRVGAGRGGGAGGRGEGEQREGKGTGEAEGTGGRAGGQAGGGAGGQEGGRAGAPNDTAKKEAIKVLGPPAKAKNLLVRDAGRVIPPHPYCACTHRTGTATQITNPPKEKKLITSTSFHRRALLLSACQLHVSAAGRTLLAPHS